MQKLYEKYSDTLSNSSSTSPEKDKPKEIVTDINFPCINFDKVKENFFENNKYDNIRSVDSLIFMSNGLRVFIEFKSGLITKNKSYEIRHKAYDTTLMSLEHTKETLQQFRETSICILVYRKEINESKEVWEQSVSASKPSPSKTYITKAILNRGNEKLIRFNLQSLEGYCFSEVATLTVEEFEDWFNKHEFIDLSELD